MRTLVLLRGAPGAGKSTWIKNNNLEPYTLSPDNLRVLCDTYEYHIGQLNTLACNFETEQKVWKILFDILEYRMSNGQFTVIDATASKTKDMNQYKELADRYRYRIYCIDFTSVPIETCLAQNKMRPTEKWVPESAIQNIYARFATQPVPAGITVINPEAFDLILEKPIDLSNYKKIVFIGDIHGCFDTLMQYPDFKNGLQSDVEYIFCGDFLDRGNQNVETLKWIISIADAPNVCLLEGNHEKHLLSYGLDEPSVSRQFENKTRVQLFNAGVERKAVRKLYRKLRQCSHFMYNGLEILACHGGLSDLNTNLLFMPTKNLIRGIGEYKDYKILAENWMGATSSTQYLVHGHRNVEKDPVQIADRVFNLEGGVEFGGKLRLVELDSSLVWNTIELDDIQPIDKELITESRPVETVEEAIEYLRNNKQVTEKKLDNNISSFNFTREAFYRKNWNRQTILARGLFLDTENKKIMARSYEKFFKIEECPETYITTLRNKLQFPVTAYKKENGFLAIVSYDYINDDLFVASKSTNKGDYTEYIKKQLDNYDKDALKTTLRNMYSANKAITLVFECIDIEHDPHIIEYTDSQLILLDAIYNNLDFHKMSYNELQDLAQLLNMSIKEKAVTFKEWEQFKDFYDQAITVDYRYNHQFIEGFVFEDSAGFMTKCKTGYYNLWKKLRGVCDQTLRCGYIGRTGMLTSAIENLFYGFCRKCFNEDRNSETKRYPYKTDLISMRNKFNKQ